MSILVSVAALDPRRTTDRLQCEVASCAASGCQQSGTGSRPDGLSALNTERADVCAVAGELGLGTQRARTVGAARTSGALAPVSLAAFANSRDCRSAHLAARGARTRLRSASSTRAAAARATRRRRVSTEQSRPVWLSETSTAARSTCRGGTDAGGRAMRRPASVRARTSAEGAGESGRLTRWAHHLDAAAVGWRERRRREERLRGLGGGRRCAQRANEGEAKHVQQRC